MHYKDHVDFVKQQFRFFRVNLGPDDQVKKIFKFENFLLVFSKQHIFKLENEQDNQYKLSKFNHSSSLKEKQKLEIKIVIYQKKSKQFFILISRNKKDYLAKYCLKPKGKLQPDGCLFLDEEGKIRSIVLDPQIKEQVYVVKLKGIYVCTISKSNQIMSKIEMSKRDFPKIPSLTKKGIFEKAPERDELVVEMNIGENIEYRTFLFDRRLKYLFIVFKKIIKQYEIKSGMVANTFEGHLEGIKEMVQSRDEKHLFRYFFNPSLDENDHIKIWNLKSGLLVTTLNLKSIHKGLSGMTLLQQDSLLAVSSSSLLLFWKLDNQVKEISFSKEDLAKSELTITNLSGEEQLFFNKQNLEMTTRPLNHRVKCFKSVLALGSFPFHQVINSGSMICVGEDGGGDEEEEEEDVGDDIKYYVDLILRDKVLYPDSRDESGELEHPNFANLKTVTELSCARINCFHVQVSDYSKRRQTTVQIPEDEEEILSDRGDCDFFIRLYFGTEDMKCFYVEFELNEDGSIDKLKKDEIFKLGNFIIKEKEKKKDKKKLKMQMMNNLELMKRSDEKTPIDDVKEIVTNQNRFVVIVFQKSSKGKRTCEIRVKDKHKNLFSQSFELEAVTNNIKTLGTFKIHPIPRSEGQDLCFFLLSKIGIALLQKASKDDEFKLVRYLKKEIKLSVGVEYSAQQNLFYLPSGRTIQVWKGDLSGSKFSINLCADIVKILKTTTEPEYLLVYMTTHYCEIDLENLEFYHHFPLSNKSPRKRVSSNLRLPINLDFFPRNKLFTVPDFNEEINSIYFISKTEDLSLKMFPFYDLKKCLEPEDYSQPISNFAQYYFESISRCNYIDRTFHTMSPIIMSIYHKNIDLLKTILETYRYPRLVEPNYSPLIFAFYRNLQSSIKIICDQLLNREYQVQFSKQDFLCLIYSSHGYCHRLLANFFQQPSIDYFPKLLNLNREAKIFLVSRVNNLNSQIELYQKRKITPSSSNEEDSGSSDKNSESSANPESIQSNDFLNLDLKKAPEKRRMSKMLDNIFKLKNSTESKLYESQESNRPGNGDDSEFLAELEMKKQIDFDYEEVFWNRKSLTRSTLISNKNDFIEEVLVNKVPFKFNYKMGTYDSLCFLKCYSSSDHEEFILSDWKEVVNMKWEKCFPIYILLTLIYWIFTIFVTLSIVFYPEVRFFRLANIALIFFFLIYEIIEILSYSSFNLRR